MIKRTQYNLIKFLLLLCLIYPVISKSQNKPLLTATDTLYYRMSHQISESVFFVNKKFSTQEIKKLISEYPIQKTKVEMLKELNKVKRNRRNRTIYGVMGISIGLLAIPPMVMYKSLGNDNSTITTIGLLYFGLGSLSILISQDCNSRYYEKRKNIILKYNNFQ